jgi:hypothetical protein
VDLDGDGHKDILSGSYSRTESSMAGLFQVLRGQADGTFTSAEVVNGNDNQPLIVTAPQGGEGYDSTVDRICTRPTAVDWDGDGHLDLVVGNFVGQFAVFKGEGSGKFAPTSDVIMLADGTDVLRLKGHHADPFVIDWDGDGDLDLLSGSTDGGVQWSENTAGPGKAPALNAFVSLIEPGEQLGQGEMLSESDLKGPTRSTRIWVDDVNEDGKLDVLVGDNTTLVSPAEGLTAEEAKQKEAEWTKNYSAVFQKYQALMQPEAPSAAGSDEGDKPADAEAVEPSAEEQAAKLKADEARTAEIQKISDELQTLYQQRSEFMTEERTGFVWLYVHK